MNLTFEFISELAQKVGSELLNFYKLEGISATLKEDNTTLTEADLEADRIITSAIKSEFPDDLIISEESSLTIDSDSKSVWIIDPLDGTTNFSLGFPYWGVSIARVTDGFPEYAAAYFPVLGELYTAGKGIGAFLNEVPIKSFNPDRVNPKQMMVSSGNAQNKFKIILPYKKRTIGSAVYEYCMVARGTATLGLQTKSKIWDLAAGYLILKEAGGKIKFINETKPFPLHSDINYNDFMYPSLIAATQEALDHASENIYKKEN